MVNCVMPLFVPSISEKDQCTNVSCSQMCASGGDCNICMVNYQKSSLDPTKCTKVRLYRKSRLDQSMYTKVSLYKKGFKGKVQKVCIKIHKG